MRSSGPTPPPRVKPETAYHHGDLRTALVASAWTALKTAPPEAISLKSLASRLGVSQPAPYRHFANREALMSAVAAEGFRRFEADLRAAASGRAPPDRLKHACLAYLAFARANMGVYRLMFGCGLAASAEAGSELAEASSSAFDFLLASVAVREPLESPAPAIVLWAALHGVAMLGAEGLVEGPPAPGRRRPTLEDLVGELVARFRA